MARTKSQIKQAKARSRGINREFDRRTEAEPKDPAEDVRIVALAARARHHVRPVSAVDRDMWECPGGQAIAIGATSEDEARDLWETFRSADAADETYSRRFVGIARFPSTSKLEFLPERFETRADDRIDTRTAADKDRDAVTAWMRWQGMLQRIGRDNHSAIVAAMRYRSRLTHAGRLTRAGQFFIGAMRALDKESRRA